MITGKYINVFIICILIIAVVFTGAAVLVPKNKAIETATSQPEYAAKLFDKSSIISIDIKADPEAWQSMLDSAVDKEYISCDVTINGTTFKSVGIRPKGNSSLSSVANSDSDRYSFKFEFDHYIEGQTYYGLDKFVINNIQGDASYMKEYLSYDLMTFIGVKTPLFAYTDVTVNGKSWGFYMAVEAIEEAYALRNFGSDYGMLYKPESMGVMGNAGKENMPDANSRTKSGAQPDMQPPDAGDRSNNRSEGSGPGAGSGGGTDLIYTDDNISSYSNIFDYQVFEGTTTDYKRVIKALKNLNNGTELEKYINVDETLRYFAANTVLVNLDSYFSSMKHNYYLYEKNGQLTMLPWDYNLSFGGFQSGTASEAVNFPIDTPVSGVDMSERPVLAKLLEVDEYKAKYHEYLQQIVDNYFDNGIYTNTIDKVNSVIGKYVNEDASAFYTYTRYEEAVKMLKEFGMLRAESVRGQLEGIIPSTSQGQTDAKDKLVDASAIDISVMGSQGGKDGEGGFGGMGRQNGNWDSSNSGRQNNNGAAVRAEEVQPQEGIQLPDGRNEDIVKNRERPFGGVPPLQGELAREIQTFERGTGNMTGKTDFILWGSGAAALAAGLIFVMKYRRNKFM